MRKQTFQPTKEQMTAGHTQSVQSNGKPTVPNTMIGGVMILPNQLIHMVDERMNNGCVRLVCKDPQDMSVMFWQYLVRTYDKTAPVTMSNVTIRDQGANIVAFAAGKRVFLVKFHNQGSIYDSVASISTMKIDDVTTGSWVSSVCAHHSPDQLNFDLMVSISVQNELRGCKLTGEVIKELKSREHLSSVTSVASFGNTIAIVSSDVDEVRLMLDDVTTVKQCGSLRPVIRMTRQRPVAVICTGSKWMVLWVGQERSKVWMVTTYNKTGQLLDMCVPTSHITDNNEPKSLARFANTGIVSFQDQSIKMFTF